MTVTTQTNSVFYVGTGFTSIYYYNFPVPTLDGFTVTRITRSTGAELDITASCTITGIGGPSGGTVTMPFGLPLAAIYDLRIKRELPLEQNTSFSNQGTIYPDVIEAALDYVMMCIIDLNNTGNPNSLNKSTTIANAWDALTFPIKNLGDGVDTDDAVNLGQMNSAIAAALVASGNVPAPVLADVGRVLTATGVGTFAWQNSAGLADNSVTNAKLVDMATQRLIGRNAAGSGAPEYVTASQVLDWVDSTRGTIPSRGASSWVGIDPGTAGHVLTSNGPGADPTYQAASSGVPAGTVIMFAANAAPTGYLKANGALVSRTTYAALFAAIGTTFGVGDGSTTFGLPDLRGEFQRGWDDGRGVDSGRVFGTAQAEMIGPHNHTASSSGSTSTDGSHTHNVPLTFGNSATPFSGPGITDTTGGVTLTYNMNNGLSSPAVTASGGSHSHTLSVSTTVNNNSGTENRPRNVALLACIKF